jgi:hypothetical protein
LKNALIIFTRNPELGKCKTRLAKTLGDQAALNIYKYLLQHTVNVSKKVNATRYVFYSETIPQNDIWDCTYFNKMLQKGNNLGERMQNAFEYLFHSGYKNVLIIGSDLLDLNETIVEQGFEKLEANDIVIGPAEDGGYYLLGMKRRHENIFKNKDWGTQNVRIETLKDLEDCSVSLLQELNDIDTFEDMKHYKQLKTFYKTND